MSSRRAVALLVLAAVIGLTIAPIGSGAVVGAITETDSADESAANTTAANTTVSTFMQTSTADAENTVEDGMFEARYEAADDERKAAIVAERTDALEAKLAALEDERRTLRDQRDDLSNGQYHARMAKLTVEIAGLERAIEKTSFRADEAGVDKQRLETLQQNASNLAGPEVAEIARGMPGQEPLDDRETGPPTEDDQSSHENPGNGEPPGQTGDEDGSGGDPPDDASGSNQGDDGGTENDDGGSSGASDDDSTE